MGSKNLIDKVHALRGCKARYRENINIGDKHLLCEMPMIYTVNIDANNYCLSADD